MTDTSRDDDANLGATFNWWWIVGGSLITGLSLFSLVATLGEIGVNGVVALVHEQYVRVRDVAFIPVTQAVRSFVPDWEITPAMRDVSLALSVFLAVVFRSVVQARQRGVATLSAVLTIPVLTFILGAFVYNVLPSLTAFTRDVATLTGALIGILAFVGVAAFVLLRQPAADKYVIKTFALNALACSGVAALLLLLNAVL